MTLIEVVISFTLLVLMVVPLFSVLVTSRQSAADARYYTAGRIGIETQVERLKALANVDEATFGSLAQQLIANPDFEVSGLPSRNPVGAHGRFTVFLDERNLDGVADADPLEMSLGGTDLNANGATNDVVPTTGLYRVLPVRLEVFWGLETTPKIVFDVILAPRFNFRRTA